VRMKRNMKSDSSQKSFFVDTNVIMYASGIDHPLKKPCAIVLTSVLGEGLEIKTSVEVMQEVLYRYSSINQLEKGLRLCRQFLTLFNPLLPVSPADIRLATDILESYPTIESRDAVHTAVALNNGIKQVISTDRHYDLIKEIKRVDPAEFP